VRYLSLTEILELHRRVVRQSGGSQGIRDIGGVESAIAQPRQTFDGQDLYPSLAQKAAALGYSLIQNHPFVDGNKRIGHAAVEVTLVLNGYEQERVILAVASSAMSRDEFTSWVERHMHRVA